MTREQSEIARRSLEDSETGARTFPEIVKGLSAGGFESYLVDFRRGTAVYYLSSGESAEYVAAEAGREVAARFDKAAMQAAIREAQTLAPGYTYKGFRARARAAGCAGYLVSFSGRRVVYFSRDADIHTEYFPGAN